MRILRKHKKVVNIINYSISILGIVIAFFTLPTYVAVIIAVLLLLSSIFIQRIIYIKPILFAHAGIEFSVLNQNRLAFVWKINFTKKSKNVHLNLLYKDKVSAKNAFLIFKAWNYNNLLDNEDNVRVTVIDEGDRKYSIFIYPGERALFKNVIEKHSAIEDNEKGNIHKIIPEIKFFLNNHSDYSNNDVMGNLMKDFKIVEKLIINTSYLKNDKIIQANRKGITKKGLVKYKREDLDKNTIEYTVKWNDINKTDPALVKDVEKIKKTIIKPKKQKVKEVLKNK